MPIKLEKEYLKNIRERYQKSTKKFKSDRRQRECRGDVRYKVKGTKKRLNPESSGTFNTRCNSGGGAIF